MSSLLFNRRFRRLCMIAGMVLLLPTGSRAQSIPNIAAQKHDQTSVQSTLDLALHYYKAEDLNKRAEAVVEAIALKQYDGTPQSESAQYYLRGLLSAQILLMP